MFQNKPGSNARPLGETIPAVSKAGLADLERRFPTTIPPKEASLWEYGRLAGIAEVIRFLRDHFNRQQE